MTLHKFMTVICGHFIMQIIFFVAITLCEYNLFVEVLLKHMTIITFAIGGLLKERHQ